MLHIYISGPMSGLKNFNYESFHEAAKVLRQLGYKVTNPAEQKVPGGDWTDYMRHDIALMMNVDCVVVLPGWRNSRGASLEVYLAKELQMPVYEFSSFLEDKDGHANVVDSHVTQLQLQL